jgi:hypothetical protein
MKLFAALFVVTAVLGLGAYVVSHEPSHPTSATTPGAEQASATARASFSRQYIVLLDVSASRSGAMISQGGQFIHAVVDTMNYGDRLVILEMYEAGVKDAKPELDMQVQKSEDVTALEEKERLDGARRGIKEAVDLFFENAAKKPVEHTDILTTLSIASEKVTPQKRNCLILLSDMLQSSRDFEFEHLQRMPHSGWIDEQQQRGLIRPLYRSSVVVVGADPSTHDGVVARTFWAKYFAASGAFLATENYRTTPPEDASVCAVPNG